MAQIAYLPQCLLLQAASELLRLPYRSTATALTFLHKLHQTPQVSTFFQESQRVVAACIFTASKVEEASLRTNDLLNAILYLTNPGDYGPVTSVFPELVLQAAAEGAAAQVLVGDKYYAVKAELIRDEQILLRLLRFDISVEHPYKYLLNYCQTLGCSRQLALVATSLVNDSLLRTALCTDTSPGAVAAGALHTASLLLDCSGDMPSSDGLAWWDALGWNQADISRVGEALVDMMEQRATPGEGGSAG